MKGILSCLSCITVLLVASGCGSGQSGTFPTREQTELRPVLPRELVTRALTEPEVLYRVVREDRYLDFSSPDAYRTLGEGWQTLDRKLFVADSWIWATGLTADITLTVLNPQDLIVYMRLCPHYIETLPPQKVDIWWEKTQVATVEFDKDRGWSPVDVTMRVPAIAQNTGANKITFRGRHAVAQQLVGAGNEPRQASFGLFFVKLTQAQDGLNPLEASAPPSSASAPPVRFLESAIQQEPHTQLVMPLRLPTARSVFFQIRDARDVLEKGGSLSLSWDTTEGPTTKQLTNATVNFKEDNSWLWDISNQSGGIVEITFANASSNTILWERPSIRYAGERRQELLSDSTEDTDWPNTRNVVLVVLDALRADALGCYGSLRPTSPSIDLLAKQGILFERCYASGTYTFASTTSLLTSLYPFQHKVVSWKDRLGDTSLLLQHVLAKEGIVTACVSQNPFLSPENVLGQGFEFFEGVFETDPGSTQKVTEKAIRLAAQAEGQSLFLYVHYLPPHAPYSMAGRFEGSLSHDPLDQLDVTPEGIKAINRGTRAASPGAIQQLRARYDENVCMADELVGDLVRGLRDLGMGEETTLVITADHGEEFLEHGWVGHASYPYDTVAHIPLIVTTLSESGVLAGRRTDIVGTVDIFPTVCRLLGATPAHTISGRDLLIDSSSDSPQDGVLAYSRGNEEDGYGAYYFERYKYICADNGRWHALYDLERDPAESTDLSDVLPVLCDYLSLTSEAWEKARSTQFALSGTQDDQRDISHQEELKAIGYL